MLAVPGASHDGPLPPLSADETALVPRLMRHIETIAARPHNIAHYDELEKSARSIEAALAGYGHAVNRQEFVVDGRTVRNIEIVIEPRDDVRSPQTVVVGAHYDSAGDAPGANDNATGTAAVIELARLLGDLRGKAVRRIRLVLFVNGNFVAFVGMLASRPLLRQAIGSFRAHAKFPSIGGVA